MYQIKYRLRFTDETKTLNFERKLDCIELRQEIKYLCSHIEIVKIRPYKPISDFKYEPLDELMAIIG